MSLKAALVVFDEAPHFLDHLAPLAIFLDLPLLLPSFKDYELVLTYYPEAKVHFVRGEELVLEQLLKKYNMLLYSTFNRRAFEKEVGACKLKTVFVPHGNSDKSAHIPLFQEEEKAFIYGARMRDFFQAEKAFVIGNYRKAYFEKKQYPSPLRFEKKQPTILYAPSLGSFHEEILEVPEHFNLVIKLHPLFERERRGLLARLPRKPHIQILEDYPLVYPLLKEIDLYVGDISSVGYDFLAFNKPLVFIEGEGPLFSHRFGRVVTRQGLWSGIEEALEKDTALYETERKEGYEYTFAEPASLKAVYEALRCYYEN